VPPIPLSTHVSNSTSPLIVRRRYSLLFLFVFPCLLLAIYLFRPRTRPCPSACIAFIGDSITSNWPMLQPPNQLSGLQIVNRGLPGDTTTNMLVRFRRDILQLRPRAVVILGGINDLARIPLPDIEHNLATMAQEAAEHKIRVVLATLPPTGKSGAASSSFNSNRDQLTALNTWLVSLAAQNHYTLLDFHSALSDSHGSYQPGLTYDGVHPAVEGYARIEPLLRQAVASALGGAAP